MNTKKQPMRRTFQRNHYQVKQLLPAAGWKAVRWHDRPDGKYGLVADEMDFLGLSDLHIEKFLECGTKPQSIRMDGPYNALVPVRVHDGALDVDAEFDDYVGLLRPGQDLREASAWLLPEVAARLADEFKLPPKPAPIPITNRKPDPPEVA